MSAAIGPYCCIKRMTYPSKEFNFVRVQFGDGGIYSSCGYSLRLKLSYYL